LKDFDASLLICSSNELYTDTATRGHKPRRTFCNILEYIDRGEQGYVVDTCQPSKRSVGTSRCTAIVTCATKCYQGAPDSHSSSEWQHGNVATRQRRNHATTYGRPTEFFEKSAKMGSAKKHFPHIRDVGCNAHTPSHAKRKHATKNTAK